ncbi:MULTISPECIES: competence type IV pilus assembly protein ComGB [Bacillaceae]|uniref:competence type IV pilus assembly protein ComGB n=1 Tax=Bacillaceae TaxID=186817 RepID=UPI001A8D216D|nr:competence type IV pilus assembly protein ComGB [Bacillus sp. NTK034]MBN8200464.1 type II secretion system F family protein [Bacillus sp. NTK034]
MQKHKWTIQEQGLFLKNTGELLSRGYPLSEALESLMHQLPPKRKHEISQCLSQLKEGFPFYQILADMNFNKNLIGYVYFAEQHGGLASAFLEGSEMVLRKGKDIEKLQKLMAYPIFLMFITAFLFVFVDKVLLPRFSSLFVSMHLQPNFFTKAVYLIGDLLPLFILIVLVVLVTLLIYYFFRFRKLSPIQQKKVMVKIPAGGHFLRLYYTHFFAVQLSHLLNGGLSIHEAFSLFEKNDKQPFYSALGEAVKIKLREGNRLEDILMRYPFFERELANIIIHGQKNGRLDQELSFFSSHCLKKLEEKTEKLLKMIQPILYIFIGFLIVSMYLAVLLPMFHLLEGF